MKRTTRNLLIMLAVLVVLGGAATALLLTKPAEEPASSAVSSTVTEKILDKKDEDISSVKVENADGSYEIVPGEAKAETSVSSGEASGSGINFTINGYEEYGIDTAMVSTAARSAFSMIAAKNLGQQAKLEDFGLSGNGKAKITVSCKDGTSDVLIVGEDSTGTGGKYLLKDGTVYITSGISSQLFGTPLDYLSRDVYTVADIASETPTSTAPGMQPPATPDILYSFKLSGTNFQKPIEISYDSNKSSGYLVTSPVKSEAGTEKFNAVIAALKTFTADSVADVGITDEKLAQYGLDKPFAQVDFNMNGEKHSLKTSATDDEGNRYVVADDKNMIYKVTAEKVSAWADVKLMDLRMNYIWLPNIMDVSLLKLTVDGTESSFAVTRTKNEEKSTETNTSYDLTIKSGAGKDIDYANYQGFYKQLISAAVLTTDESAYSGAPKFKVEYGYFDGSTPSVVEFYSVQEEDRYAAVLDGIYSGLVRKSTVDSLIALVPKLNNNEATVTD